MKATFKSNDLMEIKRLAKSQDMAMCLWEIVHNGWREFKDTDVDYQIVWEKIDKIMKENNVDINDLIN